ncbi:MAG TPA: substrate-binding domain-containing protein [Bryobacteraceae bacterium]|nr:substrate-binding domain-containing protein [Bryobacteraceae bacterium]
MKSDQTRERYLVTAVLRACDILEAFQSEAELLRIRDVADRTGLARPTALRLLYTLERRGLVERVGSHEYRLGIRPLKRRPFRIGHGAHSSEFSFSRDVAEGLARAARQEGVDLLVLDNRYSAKAAIRNVETFIRDKVDLVVEFQADEHLAAPVISAKLMEAGIPLIAVEIPHPGATYYGANNYMAGLIGGRYLGRWAKQHWHGEVDEVIMLELRMSGPIPAARLTGALIGIRELLPGIPDSRVVRLNGNGRFGTSLEVVRKHIRQGGARRTLVAAINDPSAIGALRAFEEAGRADRCAVMGQNASPEARVEMRRPESRLVGSVGYFPEKYGDGIISLALDILRRKPVPPAAFTTHQLITRDNVDHYYPNDALLAPADADVPLLRSAKRPRTM